MNINIKNNVLKDKKEKMYHTDLSISLIDNARIALLPGDPGRVPEIAIALDSNAKKIANHREYCSYLAHVNNIPVLVMSTGMGCPSVAIGLEEIACLGVKNFIRIGTTGCIQKTINIGDIILSSSSVRLEGTSVQYAPIEYPAVADLELNQILLTNLKKHSHKYHFGVTASTDTFFPGQERYGSYSGYVRRKHINSIDEYRHLNVLNFEMESSALFVWSTINGLRSSGIYAVIAKRTTSEVVDKSKYASSMKTILLTIKDSITEIAKLKY